MPRASLAGNPFVEALKELNTRLCKELKQGERKYFIRDDLIDIFQKFKGRCAVCGLYLQGKGRHPQSAHFVLKVSPMLGGRVEKHNLLLVCPTHNKQLAHPYADPVDRVFNFNAFSDLIVQLVNATIEKDKDKITYFKVCVDNALTEFITNLRYVPIAKPKELKSSYELDVGISEAVIDITKILTNKLKEINLTKSYVVLKDE